MVDGDCQQWLIKQVRWTQSIDQLGDAALVDMGPNVSNDEVRGIVGGESKKLHRDCRQQWVNVEQLSNE